MNASNQPVHAGARPPVAPPDAAHATELALARRAALAQYLSPEQTEAVCAGMEHHAQDWLALVAQLSQQQAAGVRPSAPEVQNLVGRWQQLVHATYGDDIGLVTRVRHVLANQPELMPGHVVDENLMVFIYQGLSYYNRLSVTSEAASPKPSAQVVAIQRALHQILDTPRVLHDPLALKVLAPADAQGLQAHPSAYDNPMARGLRSSLVVRSRLAEDLWDQAASLGTRQCVILGAGLDTLAYRTHTPGRYFEVDLPSTQAWKRERLQAAAIELPEHLTLVPVNFERDDLGQCLRQAGFRFDQPAFFIWLGVVMYLTDDAINTTLRHIAQCAAPTGVVFDYAIPPQDLAPVLRVSAQIMMQKAGERGEAWKSFFRADALQQRLLSSGLGRVQHFAPDDLNARYLAGRRDGLYLAGITRLVQAQNG